METSAVVRARQVSKSFGEIVALDAVDLDVPAGQVHGLIGPNGAGKTTLLGLLLGLARVSSGSLEVLGADLGMPGVPPAGVAGFVDGPGLYPSLTARQNLAALAALRGGRRGGRRGDRRGSGRHTTDARVTAALDEVGLGEVADDRLRGFSLGMRQRLGLAAALLTEPRLLVLDEPSNGLDPAGTRQVHRVLTRLADTGVAIVMSSHRMDELAALCDEVTILHTGRVVFSGPVGKLAAESGDLDYRVVTSRPDEAARIAAATNGVRLVTGGARSAAAPDALTVHGPVAAIDDLVGSLVRGGIAIRELGPVVPPLEAAFLALTDGTEEGAR
ncbi:ABC transporter ATP-binding protein [Flexivirga sp. ID2601S]|uniref:ABC transporter ATP-binding protein n=1 Tax=Flexivirga aerilata TaxID=1656889 RepID=A0A849AX20_9MICO|nr:ABC transporter ATP-binding protein [Flexivirga aerilata]NNG41212.1 ABC transporter ATP-binding protein [Flexivirga aerilata]